MCIEDVRFSRRLNVRTQVVAVPAAGGQVILPGRGDRVVAAFAANVKDVADNTLNIALLVSGIGGFIPLGAINVQNPFVRFDVREWGKLVCGEWFFGNVFAFSVSITVFEAWTPEDLV